MKGGEGIETPKNDLLPFFYEARFIREIQSGRSLRQSRHCFHSTLGLSPIANSKWINGLLEKGKGLTRKLQHQHSLRLWERPLSSDQNRLASFPGQAESIFHRKTHCHGTQF